MFKKIFKNTNIKQEIRELSFNIIALYAIFVIIGKVFDFEYGISVFLLSLMVELPVFVINFIIYSYPAKSGNKKSKYDFFAEFFRILKSYSAIIVGITLIVVALLYLGSFIYPDVWDCYLHLSSVFYSFSIDRVFASVFAFFGVVSLIQFLSTKIVSLRND